MDLKIERTENDIFRIHGEIKFEFSMVEKALRLMESLTNDLSEHKSYLRELATRPKEPRPSVSMRRFLSVRETAEYFGIAPRTIYNKISRGCENPFPIQPKRLGRRVLFDINDLRKFNEKP